jgi:hypothetical protein
MGASAGISSGAVAGQISTGATSSGGANSSGGASGGAAGRPASGGAAGGSTGAGSGGTGGASVSSDFATGLKLEVHSKVSTVLIATWTQTKAAEQTWLEFSFEAGDVRTSRPSAGSVGAHRDVVLGVPSKSEVTVRVVSSQGGSQFKTPESKASTGALPSSMPTHEVIAYDPKLASPERFMYGAVEDSVGGKVGNCCYWDSTWWIYIMDRKGRIVWYYADPARKPTSSFPRKARDGEYLLFEMRPYSAGTVRGAIKMTLDWEYFEEISVPGLSDCVDITDSGSLLYDASSELREMTRAGAVRTIWSCRDHFGADFECYTNTVNWNPLNDSVFMAYPSENTLIEVDRENGDVVAQFGKAKGSWEFSPTWNFEYPHFPNITSEGTLLVSSHMPGFTREGGPVAGQHAFIEFTIDRANEVLIQKWLFTGAPEFPQSRGMALRLPNGNTLANYGPAGVIREITPDKQTAFQVKFDVPTGDDFFNKLIGHNDLIDDLYTLNGGGPD